MWLTWLMWLIFLRMFSLICAAGTEVTVVENAVPTVLFQGHTFLCGTHVIHCLVWAPPCGRVKSVKTETCVDLFLAVVREPGSTSYSVVVVGFFLFFLMYAIPSANHGSTRVLYVGVDCERITNMSEITLQHFYCWTLSRVYLWFYFFIENLFWYSHRPTSPHDEEVNNKIQQFSFMGLWPWQPSWFDLIFIFLCIQVWIFLHSS